MCRAVEVSNCGGVLTAGPQRAATLLLITMPDS
jgi:hypothetical protein